MPLDLTKELSVAGVILALIVMDYLKIDDQPLKFLLMGLVPTIMGYQGLKNALPSLTQAQPPTGTPPVSQ